MAGVPRIEPDYTQDIATWWRLHPYNPANPAITITHPAPSVDASTFGGSGTSGSPYKLQAAINSLSSGGTLNCPAGVYDLADVIGVSHLHVRGVSGTIFRGLNLCGNQLTRPLDTGYPAFVTGLKMLKPAAIAVAANPTMDYYLSGITFDANNRVPLVGLRGNVDYVNLGVYGVRDILVDSCAFQNVGFTASASYGAVTGIGGLYNVWFRSCAWHGNNGFPGYPTNFITFDGPIACGILNSTVDGFFNGAAEWQDDEDMTVNLSSSGVLERSENHDSRYCVLSGINSSADMKGITIEGYAQLVENCVQSVNVANFITYKARNLDDWSQTPVNSGVWHGGYVGTGSVFRNNTIHSCNDSFIKLDATFLNNALSPEGTPAGGQNSLGLMSVTGNVIQVGANPIMTITEPNQAISTPCIVQGNSPNDNVVGGSIRADANVAWALSDEGPNWGAGRPPVRSSFI